MISNSAYISIYTLSISIVISTSDAFLDHVKIGVSVGTRSGANMPSCMVPELQLLSNLYVDYFQSDGPCMTPEGTRVYTFKNSAHASDSMAYTYGTVCSKLPKICHLLRRPSGRGLMSMGQNMVDSFKQNMNVLYDMLTGRTTPAPDNQFNSRFGPLYKGTPPPFAGECQNGVCVDYGIGVCETEENVAFPVLGKSAISNATVTILQEFPERVQPIFFRKCKSYKPQVIYGRCIQEYLPVSVYVSSLYADSILAQDFVMVESGCHVIADISYQGYGREDIKLLAEPRDEVDIVNRTNVTQPSASPAGTSQEAKSLKGNSVFAMKSEVYSEEGERRQRISDRRLF